jgi:hypothetical protein
MFFNIRRSAKLLYHPTAESYLSDAIFKLKKLGHDNNINVSEDIYHCEKIKRETDVKIGAADRTK